MILTKEQLNELDNTSIGGTVSINGVILMCIRSNFCPDCYFQNHCLGIQCERNHRGIIWKDAANIIGDD